MDNDQLEKEAEYFPEDKKDLPILMIGSGVDDVHIELLTRKIEHAGLDIIKVEEAPIVLKNPLTPDLLDHLDKLRVDTAIRKTERKEMYRGWRNNK